MERNDYLSIMSKNYNSKNRHKYLLKCHLIFCVKYRKKLLVGILNDMIKNALEKIAKKSDFDIETMESDRDHIHFLINYPPTLSISSIVRRLKQESTVAIWEVFTDRLKREFWAEKTFWSDGYFVCSVGEANSEIVENYIN